MITVTQARMPPTPRPVTNRITPSVRADGAAAASSMPAIARLTAASSVGRRPHRSARLPSNAAPTAMPISVALISQPSCDPLSANSSCTRVEVKDIAAMS